MRNEGSSSLQVGQIVTVRTETIPTSPWLHGRVLIVEDEDVALVWLEGGYTPDLGKQQNLKREKSVGMERQS